MDKKRYIWVDNVKVIAIILIAIGHLLQSFVKSGLIAETSLYTGFNNAIYMFHVPLFFICSGFLYQRLTKSQDLKAYGKNLLKKLIALGIPYCIFVTISYVLKEFFESSVNTQNSSFLNTFFVDLPAPYWFLYALFLLFLVSPILKNKIDATIRLIIAFGLNILVNYANFGFMPAFIKTICVNICLYLFWFVLGMAIAFFESDKKFNAIYFVLFIIFVLDLVLKLKTLPVFLTFFACFGIINLIGAIYKNREQTKVFGFVAKYTMPIFLMHTIFAAGTRAILFKIGVDNVIIHLICGLIASFLMPIIAAMIMEKIKLDFVYNPTKYIKIK